MRTLSISQQVGGRDDLRANGDIIHNSDSLQTLRFSTLKTAARISDEEIKGTATEDGLLFHILFESNIHVTNWTPMVLKALGLVIEVSYPLRNWMRAIDFFKLEQLQSGRESQPLLEALTDLFATCKPRLQRLRIVDGEPVQGTIDHFLASFSGLRRQELESDIAQYKLSQKSLAQHADTIKRLSLRNGEGTEEDFRAWQMPLSCLESLAP